jgi:hypothetical protein
MERVIAGAEVRLISNLENSVVSTEISMFVFCAARQAVS